MPGRTTAPHVETLGSQSITSCDDFGPRIIGSRVRSAAPFAEIESLAGVFHPHAIEVQDFSHYALVIDVRSRAEYEDDHIPGAVRVDLPPQSAEPAGRA